MSMNKIIIKGAKEHNLKNISLKIPKDKLVVFTGVSGSGKSSLAFDTLYNEGQRRYVESLSSYARQFLQTSSRPDVDLIEGLSPSIAIGQKAISQNPRSTVGTITEIYDYLRLLYARIGHRHCPKCGREISKQSIGEIVEDVFGEIEQEAKTEGTAKVYILSPLVKERKGSFEKLFDNLQKEGYEKARADGYFIELNEKKELLKNNKHTIEAVIDKLLVTEKKLKDEKKLKSRLFESARQALDLSDGMLLLLFVKDKSFGMENSNPEIKSKKLYSQKFSCPECNISIEPMEPNSFSFNSPAGACGECKGLGVKLSIDRSKVPDWRAEQMEARYYNTTSDYIRSKIEKLMIKRKCEKCKGARLKQESLSVTIKEKNIYQLSLMPLGKLDKWIKDLDKLKSEKERKISGPITRELLSRLKFLLAVGLDYLDLERVASSLSTGEGQRIRLASQIGTGLTGILYILDEPTVGLHPRDNARLIKTLEHLREIGNTVVIIEHDREVCEHADWIVDFGPGAGKEGGKIVFEGTLGQIKKSRKSLTGQYLSGEKKIPICKKNKETAQNWLKILRCKAYNLKNIEVNIPLNRMVCITGVSGSGKSTLMEETIYKNVKKVLGVKYDEKPGEIEEILGAEKIDKVLLVDQSPIGKTSRSNPATYTSCFTEIRKLFAQTKGAKIKGFGKSYFSFNTQGGRCEACRGQGEEKVEMQFLQDIWVKCEVCGGKRFIDQVLDIGWRGKNIYEVLQLTVDEAREFFADIPKIVRKLERLQQIGLGYLQLGQASPTLSGGEAQRLKIARELVKRSRGNTLYLLDEPTVGLHFEDLKKLIGVLKELVNKGNSVVIIEHNLDLIKNADWIIDLGPEGGERGGRIVGQGSVGDIVKEGGSYTGKYLKHYL